ncbi:MAG: serine protease, partial [Verrucomicrobiota bacterium]
MRGESLGIMPTGVIDKVRSACVEVLVDRQLRGGGAFVQTSTDGNYVITAAHLFSRPNANIRVVTSLNQQLVAKLIAVDLGHDLALLKVGDSKTLPALKISTATPQPTVPIFNFGPALRRRT